jgi:hypothetical protein
MQLLASEGTSIPTQPQPSQPPPLPLSLSLVHSYFLTPTHRLSFSRYYHADQPLEYSIGEINGADNNGYLKLGALQEAVESLGLASGKYFNSQVRHKLCLAMLYTYFNSQVRHKLCLAV